MKKLSLLFLVLSSYSLRSQTDTTYIIKPGENIFDVVLLKDIYRYPGFIQGSVLFRDGRSVRSRLNYNMLISQVQFIDMKGDTLSLAEEETIKYVVIAQDSFCYDDGYIELMVEDGKVRMGQVRRGLRYNECVIVLGNELCSVPRDMAVWSEVRF